MFCLPNSSGWVLLVGGLPPSAGDTGTQAPSRLWLWPPPGHPHRLRAAGSGDGAALSRKPAWKPPTALPLDPWRTSPCPCLEAQRVTNGDR